MNELKDRPIDLNKLYKVLRDLDDEILKKFDDQNLSDDEFFAYGIKFDIISNTLNVLINGFVGNLESPGVDNSCRSIIEALVILKMYENGDISELQKRIYRYSYTLVDYGNYETYASKAKEFPQMRKFFEDREKAISAVKERFKCDQAKIEKEKRKISNPNFYLQKKLKDNWVNFNDLLNDYPIGEEKTIEAYDFFSVFIHPRCEMNDEIEKALMKFREIYIKYVYQLVFQFLEKYELLTDNPKHQGFKEDYSARNDLIKSIYNLEKIDSLFENLTVKLCIFKNGSDMFTWHHLKRLKHLFKDMQVSLSLGFKEHTIKCLKSLYEQQSIFFKVNSATTLQEFEILKKAFWITSRIQIESRIENITETNKIDYKEYIEELYNSYYKGKYGLNSADDLYEKMCENSYFFLTGKKKGYTELVLKMIDQTLVNENIQKDMKTLYSLALDLSHASGYAWNASQNLIDTNCHKALKYCWTLLQEYILRIECLHYEKGLDANLKEESSFVFDQIKAENMQIEVLLGYYKKDIDESMRKGS